MDFETDQPSPLWSGSLQRPQTRWLLFLLMLLQHLVLL